MKKKLFSIFTVIVLFFLCFSKASNAQTNNYSLLINDSYSGAMFIDRYQDGSIEGTIISYGGYKWFKEVYEIKSKKEKTSTHLERKSFIYQCPSDAPAAGYQNRQLT